MERWRNKVAIVTGACNGLGGTCSIDLVKAGMIVAALGQQEQSMTELDLKLPEELKDRIHIMKCDVSNEQEVIKSFKWVSENLGPVHVLLCFAVIVSPMDLVGKYSTPRIKEMVDVNVNGIVYCVREGFNQMKEHEIDGHIVLLNSVVGHNIPKSSPLGSFNIAPATKFATTALTETYRQEFSNAGTNVKITVSLINFANLYIINFF